MRNSIEDRSLERALKIDNPSRAHLNQISKYVKQLDSRLSQPKFNTSVEGSIIEQQSPFMNKNQLGSSREIGTLKMSLERRSGSLRLESPIFRMPNGANTNFGSPKKSEVIKTNQNSKLMKKFIDLEDPSFDKGADMMP